MDEQGLSDGEPWDTLGVGTTDLGVLFCTKLGSEYCDCLILFERLMSSSIESTIEAVISAMLWSPFCHHAHHASWPSALAMQLYSLLLRKTLPSIVASSFAPSECFKMGNLVLLVRDVLPRDSRSPHPTRSFQRPYSGAPLGPHVPTSLHLRTQNRTTRRYSHLTSAQCPALISYHWTIEVAIGAPAFTVKRNIETQWHRSMTLPRRP